ncbi:MAG TPA: hypothetical protein VFE30_11965 [Anaeromyxobacteraceae bacterium]|nr:hypothetical protein [Anaeromyxobacteraceae bacterium]
MKRIALLVVAAALSACGGGSSNNNISAAANKTFSYGTAGQASLYQTSAVSSQLSSLSGATSSTSSSSAQAAVGTSGVTGALLTGSSLSYLSAASTAQALSVSGQALTAGASFDNPACVTQPTLTSVNFANCTVTSTSTSFTDKLTVNGSFAVVGDLVTWNVTANFALSGSGVTENVVLKYSGNFTVTSAAIKGTSMADVNVSASGNGQSATAEVSEAVVVDVTRDATGCINGGTVEAKRVWVTRPNVQGTTFADQGARITWTGCNTATIAFSN